jgi:predicted MFS family arabinose efflux permease
MQSSTWRTPMIVLICGTAILFVSFGMRQNLGLYMEPISRELNWGRETFAFAIALQSLVWGVSTPILGAFADRHGPAKVLTFGGVCYVAGMYILAQTTTPMDANIGVGLFTGLALSATGFPVVLSVVGRMVGPKKRSLYLGIASAGGSSGQVILVPLGQWFVNDYGWVGAVLILSVMAAIIVPLSAALAGGNAQAPDETANQKFGDAMREAGGHLGFHLLTAGYFVCGFQTMFFGAHFPAYLTDLGQPSWLGATSLALIGGFNIIGCIAWGHLGQRYPIKYLLAWLYFWRSVVMMVFIMSPITTTSVILFSSIMGTMWLGTVPLTAGLVVRIFGTQYMATLVGIAFLSHQLGSFLGIWLGGVVYDAMGNYDAIFWGGIIMGFIATALHYPINDTPLRQKAAASV